MLENTFSLLKDAIYKEWENTSIPNSDNLVIPDEHFFTDAQETRDWLSGKNFHYLVNLESLEFYMPFYYLTPLAIKYYIAGYLLNLIFELNTDIRNFKYCFGSYHLINFLVSEKFLLIKNIFSDEHKKIINCILEIVYLLMPNLDLEIELQEKLHAYFKKT